jgi:glycine/D-amino acid oxidase-like deaminating enzyme
MSTICQFDAAGFSAVPQCRHAVVISGGLAGMLAARVVSEHFDNVTVLERDRFPPTTADRKGLPQGRHAHALLERGRGALERFFPGLTEEMVQAGAQPLDATQDVAWMNPYGWYVRFPGDLRMLASTRALAVDRRVTPLSDGAASATESTIRIGS